MLDVAGGTGALSFELENLNGIGCCVLDPRPLRLGRLRKRQRYNLFSSNPFFARYIDVEDYAKRAPRIPRQLRVFLDEPLVEWVAGGSGSGSGSGSGFSWSAALERGSSVSWTEKGLSDAPKQAGQASTPQRQLLPPTELFRTGREFAGMYSEWDERGLPLADGGGFALSKNARKKLERRQRSALNDCAAAALVDKACRVG